MLIPFAIVRAMWPGIEPDVTIHLSATLDRISPGYLSTMPAAPPVLHPAFVWFVNIYVFAVVAAFTWAGRRLFLGLPLLPEQTAHRNRVVWGPGTLVFVLIFPQLLGLIVVGLYEVATTKTQVVVAVDKQAEPPKVEKPAPNRKPLSSTELIALNTALSLIVLLIVPPMVRSVTGATYSDFGLSLRGTARDLKIGAVAFLLLTPLTQVSFLIATKFYPPQKHPLEEMLRSEKLDWQIIPLAFAASMILAPLVEELIFRGLIQGWLSSLYARKKHPTPELEPELESAQSLFIPLPLQEFSPSGASIQSARVMPILITSLIFAGVHYPQMPAPFAIFVLSLGLGILYQRTQRLLPSITLHALFNGFNTTMMVLQLLSNPHHDARNQNATKKPLAVQNRGKSLDFSLAHEDLAVRFPEAQ